MYIPSWLVFCILGPLSIFAMMGLALLWYHKTILEPYCLGWRKNLETIDTEISRLRKQRFHEIRTRAEMVARRTNPIPRQFDDKEEEDYGYGEEPEKQPVAITDAELDNILSPESDDPLAEPDIFGQIERMRAYTKQRLLAMR